MISDKEIKELEGKYNVRLPYYEKDDSYSDDSYCNYDHYTIWSGSKMKAVKLPKKEIDKNWLAEKIENYLNATSKNLRKEFQKLDIKGSIYYTSFGLSYDCCFKSDDTFDKEIQAIKDKLSELKIKFSNEFSDARWVYRFRISQSKENLELIKAL